MQDQHAKARVFIAKYITHKIVSNNVNSWRILRKGNWPILKKINIEGNRATDIKWLTELNISSKMELFCVESMKEGQKIYNYSCCAKLKMVHADKLCKNCVTQACRATFQ